MTHPVETYLSTLAPSTRRVAAGDLRTVSGIAWAAAGAPPAAPPWDTLGVDQGSGIRAALAARYAPATANRMLSNVRGVVRASWRLGLLTWDAHVRLLASLPAVRGGRLGKGRALTWPEVERLLAAAADLEEQALLAVACGAGLRRAELCALRWAAVESEPLSAVGGRLHLRVLGKGNTERRVRLPIWASGALQGWLVRAPLHAPFVFRWRDGRSVWSVVDAAAARAGLGRVAPHDLRRTFASLALGTGIQVADLRRMMGHASVATTMRYDRRPDAEVMEAAAKLDHPGALDTPRRT